MMENKNWQRFEEIGIDVHSALERFANKEELFLKTIRRFAEEIVRDGMKDFPETENPLQTEEFKRYIHSLKGVTGNLSMVRAYVLLREFDQALKEGRANEIQYKELCRVLAEQADIILNTPGNRETAASEASNRGSRLEFGQLLEELETFLKMAKAKECEAVMAKLKSRNWGDGIDQGILEQIYHAVEEYDYGSAIHAIAGLKNC